MKTCREDVLIEIKDNIKNYIGLPVCDLQDCLFNSDYFIIGYEKAEKWLQKDGIFQAIKVITSYEKDNFGEVATDFSDSEKVTNMYAYILGEELLLSSETYCNNSDNFLTEETAENIIEDLDN